MADKSTNATVALRQSVVLAVGTNPFPKKAVCYEMADSTIMDAHASRPVLTAHFLELQRGMTKVLFQRTNFSWARA